MMDVASYEELSQHFEQKLDGLGTLIKLRYVSEDEIAQLQLLHTELADNQNDLSLLKSKVALNGQKLTEMKKMNETLKCLKSRLLYAVENIPKRLPGVKSNTEVDEIPAVTVKKPLKESRAPNAGAGKVVVTNNIKEATSIQRTAKLENTYLPELEFLTIDEFGRTPKYLKGRLSYDQVNKFMEGMNKAYMVKYNLLKLKKTSLNNANQKLFETYKMQESKETKGCYFIVEADMKEHGNLKIDNVARSILTILRHYGRCREVRGGGVTRYVYIDNY